MRNLFGSFLIAAAALCLTAAGCGDDDGDPVYECGNNEADPGEACDGSDLRGASCSTLGLGIGTLACTDTCILDKSGCLLESCGNGVLEPPLEECDASNLNGADCTTFGYSEGWLQCDHLCKYDTSDCSGTGENCGNGIQEGQEECDGDDLDGYDCYMMGFMGGGTLACDEYCLFDTSGCNH